MTSADSEREKLIRLEERHDSLLKELRSLEHALNEKEIENKTLRFEAKQFTAIKDQYSKGFINYLLDIVKLCIAVILALLGAKYGIPK